MMTLPEIVRVEMTTGLRIVHQIAERHGKAEGWGDIGGLRVRLQGTLNRAEDELKAVADGVMPDHHGTLRKFIELIVTMRNDVRERQQHYAAAKYTPHDQLFAESFSHERASLNILLTRAAELGLVPKDMPLWDGE